MRPALAALLFVLVAALSGCGGGGDDGGVRLVKVAGGFDQPLDVGQLPGRPELVVAEKPGVLALERDGRRLTDPFLDIRKLVDDDDDEEGLLSFAFDPDYRKNGLFYVYYSATESDYKIAEFHARPGAAHASPLSVRTVLEVDYGERTQEGSLRHVGGAVRFGLDGDLYLGTGDGSFGVDPDNSAQNLEDLRGKLLRIDPQRAGDRPYTVPPDNPLVGKPGRDEIYSWGLRNPWRYSFDRKSDSLLIGDVGYLRFEEVNRVSPAADANGANFGWPAIEGEKPFRKSVHVSDPVAPALVYKHGPGCAVTGGYVIRDPDLSGLDGKYLYGDYCSGDLRVADLGSDQLDDHSLGLNVKKPVSFGLDDTKRIYITAIAQGTIYRLAPK